MYAFILFTELLVYQCSNAHRLTRGTPKICIFSTILTLISTAFECVFFPFVYNSMKEFVLLRRAISLKVNYEKVKISNWNFCDNLFDNTINNIKNKGNGEINTA